MEVRPEFKYSKTPSSISHYLFVFDSRFADFVSVMFVIYLSLTFFLARAKEVSEPYQFAPSFSKGGILLYFCFGGYFFKHELVRASRRESHLEIQNA